MRAIGRTAAEQPPEESIEFVPKRELDRAQQENERLRKQSEWLQKENERLKQETERLRHELEAALRASKRQAAPGRAALARQPESQSAATGPETGPRRPGDR